MGVATGTFTYPNGSPVASGLYQWKLSSDAVKLGSACVCPPLFTGLLDNSGNMTATFLFNDVLGTAYGTNTTYQLTVKDLSGRQVWNENYYLTGTAANINLVAPGSGPGGAIFFPAFGSLTVGPLTTESSNCSQLYVFDWMGGCDRVSV
jgi:hypothetical protein